MALAYLRIFRSAQAMPAFALIIAGTYWRIRSPLYYVLGGGLALAVAPFIFTTGDYPNVYAKENWTITILMFFLTGLAAGGVFWLLAGRWHFQGLFR